MVNNIQPMYYRRMGKELISIELERDSLQQKWGFVVQGGADVSLTAKIASVKVIPASAIIFLRQKVKIFDI